MRASRYFVVGLLALLAVASPSTGAKELTIAELTNFTLSPELAQWLVGPISRIASRREVAEYLSLQSDQAAVEFIDFFWASRRSASNPWPDQQPRAIFEGRAEEADRLFTEGVNLGRRTDRGAVHVLYGPPAEKSFESDPDRYRDPVEVWEYEKNAPKGLDGKKPKRFYRFIKRGEATVFLAPANARN